MLKVILKSIVPAIAWLAVTTILHCIPGQKFPSKNWFHLVYLDKWIHVGMFAVMIVLWCFPLFLKVSAVSRGILAVRIMVIFMFYGIVMELVQHFLIANRTLDWMDVAADAVGCVVGLWFVRKYHHRISAA